MHAIHAKYERCLERMSQVGGCECMQNTYGKMSIECFTWIGFYCVKQSTLARKIIASNVIYVPSADTAYRAHIHSGMPAISMTRDEYLTSSHFRVKLDFSPVMCVFVRVWGRSLNICDVCGFAACSLNLFACTRLGMSAYRAGDSSWII